MDSLRNRCERWLREKPRITSCAYAAFGACLTLTFAPFGLFFLAPLLALPMLFAALVMPPRRSARYAFFFGFGLFLSGTYWIVVSVHDIGRAPLWVALVLMFGLVLIMAGYMALIGWSMARLANGRVWRLTLVGPAAWVLVEWLRGWLFTGFPWLSLGYAQIDSPLAGWAPVIGIYGVSWLLLVSAAGLLATFAAKTNRSAGIALVAIPWVVGALLATHVWTIPSGPPITATIVQGGVPQERKWLPEQLRPTLGLYRNALLATDNPLVVWPEVAIPAPMQYVGGYLEQLQTDLRDGQTLALGMLEPTDDGDRLHNSVLVLDGATQQTYRKRHLVPYGEYFPVPDFVRGWMRRMDLPYNDMVPGEDEQPLLVAADGTRMAAAICYEDAYGAEQLYALPEAAVLINVSNDAWFGESIAPHQHLEVARMRALEAGRWVVRATNNGVSAFIGPDGTVTARAPQFEFATLEQAIEPRAGLTPYARTGNLPLLALLALIVIGTAVRNRNQ